VEEEWLRTFAVRPNIDLDSFVVMPNHIHGIAIFQNSTIPVEDRRLAAVAKSPTQTIGALVRGFKGACTRRLVAECALAEPIWQRNYYDHVVRDEPDLDRIRDYIAQNPERWMARADSEANHLRVAP
jgi:putative transposase